MVKKITKDDVGVGLMATLAATLIIAIGASAYSKIKEESEQNKEEERKEVRAKQFAEYIVSEISEAAKNPELSNWSIEYYKRDPKGAERLIKSLEADSTKYADAIFRDARTALNWVGDRADNALTFQEAAARVAQQGFEPIGPGRPADAGITHLLNVNMKHLKDTSMELAAMRKAKSMVD